MPPPSVAVQTPEDAEDGLLLLKFLNKATTGEPALHLAPSLQYVEQSPPPMPQPPPPMPQPPPKHHHRPEYVPPPQASPRRRASDAPLVLAPPLPPQLFARPASARAPRAYGPVSLVTPRPGTAGGVSTVSGTSAAWQAITTAGWTDWSVANTAYPVMRSPRAIDGPVPAARHRYQYAGPDSDQRPRRARPTTAPVRLKHPWGEGGGPQYAAAARPVGAHALGGPVHARGLRLDGGADSLARGAGASPHGGGGAAAAKGGLGGLFKGSKLRFSTIGTLTRGLSAAQARARAMEQEREAAEKEAQLRSLRTALGTRADQPASKLSTAAAIEEAMEEELRHAKPPPREHSPVVVRRKIAQYDRVHPLPKDEPSIARRGAAGRHASHGRFVVRSVGGSGAADDGGGGHHHHPPTPRSHRPPEPVRADSSTSGGGAGVSSFSGGGAADGAADARPTPVSVGRAAPPAPSHSAYGAHRTMGLPSARPDTRSPRVGSAPPTGRSGHDEKRPPSPYDLLQLRPSYNAASAMLPPHVKADYESVSLEAPPMPSVRCRGKPRYHVDVSAAPRKPPRPEPRPAALSGVPRRPPSGEAPHPPPSPSRLSPSPSPLSRAGVGPRLDARPHGGAHRGTRALRPPAHAPLSQAARRAHPPRARGARRRVRGGDGGCGGGVARARRRRAARRGGAVRPLARRRCFACCVPLVPCLA